MPEMRKREKLFSNIKFKETLIWVSLVDGHFVLCNFFPVFAISVYLKEKSLQNCENLLYLYPEAPLKNYVVQGLQKVVFEASSS